MKKMFALFSLLFLSLLQFADADTTKKADIVLLNGHIYTMDAARTWVEAVAIQNGKIVYVGDDEGVQAWVGNNTRTIQLAGRLVLPGFIDAHVHPIGAGVGMGQCGLGDKETKEQVLAAIKECATAQPDAKWFIGRSLQLPVFENANPQKEWLDAMIPDRPALVSSADGHSTWVNSKALEIAGITKVPSSVHFQ